MTNKPKKITIGVGAGVGVLLIASILSFLVYRRKRMRAQSNPHVPTISLEPTDHLFTYEELSRATDDFSDANELGKGGFGTVYKGKLRDGRLVAVKRFHENQHQRVEQFVNEVVILNRLRHPNLVILYGCTSRHGNELLLVYEYVPNGTVADHLHRDQEAAAGEESFMLPTMRWPIRLSIAVETATALAYLHKMEPPIIHRDVKTSNILLDDNFHVKVGDFGISRLFPLDATHVSTDLRGTVGYMDPVYYQIGQLTEKSDVYSFGVVLAELISSKRAVDLTRPNVDMNLAMMTKSRYENGNLQELVDPALGFETDPMARYMIEQVAELAYKCLHSEKAMRPSMDEVVQVLQGIEDAAAEGAVSPPLGRGQIGGQEEDHVSLMSVPRI